jgi:excinuclease ABC subunit A
VGTVTEIYDYLRLLWARVGTPHCPEVRQGDSPADHRPDIDQVLALPEGTRIQVMAPVIRGKKGEYTKIFEDARRSGYVRVRVDGSLYELDEEIKLDKNKKHNIEIIIDRLVIRPDIRQRLTDSVETASTQAGAYRGESAAGGAGSDLLPELRLRGLRHLPSELTPRMFSFNNPYGACPTCMGLGSQLKADPELIVPDPSSHSGRRHPASAAGPTPSAPTASPGCISRRCPKNIAFKLTPR